MLKATGRLWISAIALATACAPTQAPAPPISSPSAPAAPAPPVASAEAPPDAGPPAPILTPDELHRSAIVVDTHNDVTQRLVLENADLSHPFPDAQTDIPRMQAGGLDAEFLSVWVPPQLYPGEKAYKYSLDQFDAIDRLVAKNPDVAVLARTAAEVRNAAAAGKIAFLIGVEGGHGLGDAPDDRLIARLHEFYDRGARYMTLTWSNSNRLGGSSGDTGKTRGLTPFGLRVVKTMNDLGMMVDVSHVSDATFFDAVKASTKPVIASHSSARALCNHPRNMTDDMLRAVRDNGGAVCINFGQEFLDQSWYDRWSELQKSLGGQIAKLAKEHPGDPKAVMLGFLPSYKALAGQLPRVPASRVVDHIDHVAQVAGIDHVCLGSDFDGIPLAPAGLDDVSKLPFITEELSRRGYSAGDIRKILGENVLRVLAANENKPAGDPSVALPGGEGGIGFDDLGYASGLRKVLAPAAGTGKLDLIDPDTLAVTSIGGFSASPFQGGHDTGTTSADEGRGLLFATDRTTRLLAVVDPSAKAIVSSAKLAGSPDYVRWVEATGELWVTEPDSQAIEVFSLGAGPTPTPVHLTDIRVPGGPESLVIDAARKKAFAHLWKGSTVAIDLPSHAVVATWPNGCGGSRGIAIDSRRGLLFAGCSEGKLSVLDIDHGGKQLGAVSSGSGVDIIAYSPTLAHAYLPGAKSATMAVVGIGGGGVPTVLGTVPTARGAHCVAADDRGHAYVCDPDHGRLLVFADAYPAVTQ